MSEWEDLEHRRYELDERERHLDERACAIAELDDLLTKREALADENTRQHAAVVMANQTTKAGLDEQKVLLHAYRAALDMHKAILDERQVALVKGVADLTAAAEKYDKRRIAKKAPCRIARVA